MPEKPRFRIVFTGEYAKGKAPSEVWKAVARLFNVDASRVASAFSKGKGTVVGSASDEAQARRLLESLTRSGAICEIEPAAEMPARKPAQSAAKPQQQKSPDRIAEFERQLPGALVVAPALGPAADITLAPLYSPRITGHAEGIDINRKDRKVIPFGSIVAISFFKASESPERLMLMLFFEGSKRPVLVETGNIIYGDFPGAGTHSTLGSLRNFLMLLHSRREGIVLDAQTAAFLAGGQPGVFLKDPLLLATAFYQAMPEALRPSPSKSVAYGAGGLDLTLPEDTAERCSKCGSRRIPERPDCPKCGFIPLKPEASTKPAEPLRETGPARLALWGAVMLLVSFSIPMLRTPNPAIWTWRLFGIGSEGNGTVASMAGQSGVMLGLWASVPLVAGLLVLGAIKLSKRFDALGRWRFHLAAVLGGFGIFALIVPLAGYSTLLRIELLPSYWKHGGFLFASVFSALLLVHISDKPDMNMRRLAVFSAVVALVAGLVLLFIYSPAGWRTWWLSPVYTCAVLLGLLGLMDALGILSGSSLPELYRRLSLALGGLSLIFIMLASVWMRHGSIGAIWQSIIMESVNNTKAVLLFLGLGVILQAGLWGMGHEKPAPAPRRTPKTPVRVLPKGSSKPAQKPQSRPLDKPKP